MRRVLFICSQNRLRSPTAEQLFASWPGIEVASAGLEDTAETPLSLEHIEWADLIFVMEEGHLDTLLQTFGAAIKSRRVICLNIPDEYEYMDPRLVLLLNAVVPRYLPAVAPSRADA